MIRRDDRQLAIGVAAAAAGLLLIATIACGSGPGTSGATSDTVFVEDFESGTLSVWADGVDPARHHIVTDSTQAHSGSRYLRVTYPAGGDGGWLTHFFPSGYDSLYVSYYVRFPAEWRGGTKLVALYGSRTDNPWSAMGKAGVCPSGDDFFAAMLIADVTGDPGPLRFYSYYPTMAREPDGVTCWGRDGDGTERYAEPLPVRRGAWHRVAFWVKLNAPGRENAAQRFWLDDVLRGTWSGFSFRRSSQLRLNAVQLTFNRGIAGGPTAQMLDVDHLVVTTTPPAWPADL